MSGDQVFSAKEFHMEKELGDSGLVGIFNQGNRFEKKEHEKLGQEWILRKRYKRDPVTKSYTNKRSMVAIDPIIAHDLENEISMGGMVYSVWDAAFPSINSSVLKYLTENPQCLVYVHASNALDFQKEMEPFINEILASDHLFICVFDRISPPLHGDQVDDVLVEKWMEMSSRLGKKATLQMLCSIDPPPSFAEKVKELLNNEQAPLLSPINTIRQQHPKTKVPIALVIDMKNEILHEKYKFTYSTPDLFKFKFAQ